MDGLKLSGRVKTTSEHFEKTKIYSPDLASRNRTNTTFGLKQRYNVTQNSNKFCLLELNYTYSRGSET